VACGPGSEPPPEVDRPNILLIVADDLGYSDLGAYGGEIETPNIDALAARGLLFTQFQTAPMCAPTRAMLLSGNSNHTAGMGNQGGGSGPTAGLPGYEGHLSDRVVPFPQLLQDAGYDTYMVGKWHLGLEAEHSPTAAGFDRVFSMLDGAGDHYSSFPLELDQEASVYWLDGAFAEYPEGRYSTEVYTDYLLQFMENGRTRAAAEGDRRPFFAFAAYTSPHWPLQVPEGERDRYAGRYDMGYDSLRVQRFQSLQDAGIVPRNWSRPPTFPAQTPWTELSEEERRVEAREMELYAAMVSNLDHHVGRLIAALEESGELDNTLIVFMSDNGAAAEDFYYQNTGYRDHLRARYTNTLETMGSPDSWVSYGARWALAGSAPFRGHKTWSLQGGITAPMIATGPGVNHTGGLNRGWVAVQDLAPTFLAAAGVRYPGARGTPETIPMTGTSLWPVLSGAEARAHDDSEVLALEHRNRAFVRQGRWKIWAQGQPLAEDGFQLFDLEADPGETTDLREVQPDQFQILYRYWEAYRDRVGVWVETTSEEGSGP
jgi:arylsulfatase